MTQVGTWAQSYRQPYQNHHKTKQQGAAHHPKITIKPNTLAIDLIQAKHGHPDHGVAGVWCLDQVSGEILTLAVDVIFLATGGVGQLWANTTNPSVATGDGLAMAYRAGAAVRDMAFIQFHPTSLSVSRQKPFLISEAMRGHGAVLMTIDEYAEWGSSSSSNPGEISFMRGYSELGSLGTRDVCECCHKVF